MTTKTNKAALAAVAAATVLAASGASAQNFEVFPLAPGAMVTMDEHGRLPVMQAQPGFVGPVLQDSGMGGFRAGGMLEDTNTGCNTNICDEFMPSGPARLSVPGTLR